ncbi:protein CREG1-like [Anopheles albimanus]|uniref:CREG-like beta-barrel domain-containing protein n=1 Tax=Anopheles albimanus TaxID=7167 RepID=A0A182FAU8_ANOAL|nr:protein CREG1-like [Anopheles albimanus]
MTVLTREQYHKFEHPEMLRPSHTKSLPSGPKLWLLFILASLTFVALMILAVGVFTNLAPFITAFDAVRDEPPPHTEYARMARYLVHKAEWVSMGSLSIVPAIQGFPMVNIISVADSARGEKSTGVLYFYLTMLDYTAQDLSKDNRLTVMISMDQDLACTKQGVDPMEPTCGRLMISGSAIKIDPVSDEFAFGQAAMYSRHPAAKKWIDTDGHNFFLCKLDIVQIAVLDFYGGPHYVTVEDYMAADPDKQAAVDDSSKRSVPARFSTIVSKPTTTEVPFYD